MLKPAKRLWPWALGATLGLAAAVVHLGVPTVAARGDGDDAVIFEIDPAQEVTQEALDELRQFAEENEGRDIILQPVSGFRILSGEERRLNDKLRAARESEELEQHIAQGYAEGLYVTGDAERASCFATKGQSRSEPGRQLLCEGEVVSAPAHLPFVRAKFAGQTEDLLRGYVYDLLEGVTPEEEARGLGSYFSNPAALQSLDMDASGAVTVDFNSTIVDQIGHVHPGLGTHTLLQQIYRTLFQFRDVTSVTLTLDGSCQGFGDVISGPCQELSRDLWELMLYENGEKIDYFTLKGGL